MFREKLEPLANSRNAAMARRREHLPRILTKTAKSAQEFKTAIFSAKEERTTAFAKSVEKGQLLIRRAQR